ncbi:metX protein [Flavobacterium enshiense DK69]|uniref:Homoserine acetyltransferase n=1 Tax=Flavobacterium enshiense DK69 TaxID=1107311 RepID=V6S343_9FLAO|nr:alpha/beta fold hydrolase [Flavobacterium enshiense]ESU21098.1 metX protein [Flavobacterium enshiense DK69]KGO95243.1 homoserine acetyltransferase [Flavobacterium enshiense DK69]
MNGLQRTDVFDFTLENGVNKRWVPLYFQVFGQAIGTAPVVLVNHALTGNSQVIGEKGWWNELIGENKTIDTNVYTVISFNIPGNGFDGNPENLIGNYKDFGTRYIAKLFWKGLHSLNIRNLFAVIGGSIGGGIAWEMAFLRPNSIKHLIPIASDWKSSDWLIANVLVQDQILNNSKNPIHDARMHAMLLYRTPESLKAKFNRAKNDGQELYQIESWLQHHGKKLESRFELAAYKLMNHLLKTIGEDMDSEQLLAFAEETSAKIHLVGVNSDYFFTAEENRETYKMLRKVTSQVSYQEIQSIHGHDAFLIEFEQLGNILKNIFTTTKLKATVLA